MASSVVEATLELEALEVIERPQPDPRAYPLRGLEVGSRPWRPSMRVVELSNPWIHAVMAPELGGRVLSLRAGGDGIDVLGELGRLEPYSSWSNGGLEHARDAFLDRGIQLLAPVRSNVTMPSLSPVEALLSPPEDEGEAASAVLGGLAGPGLGFHIVAEVAADRAELVLEARFLNRGLERPLPYWAAWRACVPDAQPFRDANVLAAVQPQTGNGVAFVFDPLEMRGREWDAGGLEIGRHPGGTLLGPRRADVFRVAVIPLEGMAGLYAADRELIAAVQGRRLRLRASAAIEGARVFVLVGGRTLEAPLSMEAGSIEELELPGEPEGLEVRSAEGTPLLRRHGASHPVGPSGTTPVPAGLAALASPAPGSCEAAYLEGASLRTQGQDPSEALALASVAPDLRPLCLLQRAMVELAAGRPQQASLAVEDALGFNAEDPLAWWLKAVADRLAGSEDAAGPELPNAHFLAPLEPALRAEAFLSQGPAPSAEPNPLLAPLAEMPDQALEVVAMTLDLGLWDEAMRLIEGLLRHREQPLLRYLLAYANLRATGMEVDVGGHLAAAGPQPVQPPYPWRSVELLALEALAEFAPGDARLAEWLEVARHG